MADSPRRHARPQSGDSRPPTLKSIDTRGIEDTWTAVHLRSKVRLICGGYRDTFLFPSAKGSRSASPLSKTAMPCVPKKRASRAHRKPLPLVVRLCSHELQPQPFVREALATTHKPPMQPVRDAVPYHCRLSECARPHSITQTFAAALTPVCGRTQSDVKPAQHFGLAPVWVG